MAVQKRATQKLVMAGFLTLEVHKGIAAALGEQAADESEEA